MKRCKRCESLRIVNVRLDSDWAYGAGDMNLVNQPECYSSDDLNEYNFEPGHPDIDIYWCLDCDAQGNDLIEEVNDESCSRRRYHKMTEYIINTASMEIDRKKEIVRCRDCKLWATELRYMGKCTGKDGKLNPNGYCAWGERRQDGE